MIRFYKTIGGKLTQIHKAERDCWIDVQQPTDDELDFIRENIGVNDDYIQTSLRDNQRSYITKGEKQYLILFDMPIEVSTDPTDIPAFFTLPIGFIATENHVVTITSSPAPLIDEVVNGFIVGENTGDKNIFLFTVAHGISSRFTMHLDNIDTFAMKVEKELNESMKNKEIIQLLSLQKALAHFTASLNSNKATLEKLLRGRVLPISDDEREILEDTLVEITQSIDTAKVYTEILASTTGAVSSIITNNMNILMKVLTSVTLVISIPNIIYGFYGMNVEFHAGSISVIIPIIVSVILTTLAVFLLYKKNLF